MGCGAYLKNFADFANFARDKKDSLPIYTIYTFYTAKIKQHNPKLETRNQKL